MDFVVLLTITRRLGMHLTYHVVSNHLNAIKGDLVAVIDKISKSILAARDEFDLPVYSIKSRVKSPESAYLKTKRKNYTSMDQITDYAGMRILCLFERNIFEINDFILKYIIQNSITLNEIKVFYFDEDSYLKIYTSAAKYSLSDVLVKKAEKGGSGYKSLHYSITTTFVGNSFTLELQLRTLLQDVWGELEHSLAYKRGAIHPHIKKSFELLSHDLQTTDALMEHLKDISDKEESGERYSNIKSGPRDYFDYEDKIIPELFKVELNSEYQQYSEIMRTIKLKGNNNILEDVAKAKCMYKKMVEKLKIKDLEDENLKYWHDMENAFFLFCEAKYEDALIIYKQLKNNYSDKYCLHFRTGEIFMKLGQIEKALTEFDESENLISNCSTYNKENLYHIKIMLALVYWMLGDEYINIAINEVLDAEKIYNENLDILQERINSDV